MFSKLQSVAELQSLEFSFCSVCCFALQVLELTETGIKTNAKNQSVVTFNATALQYFWILLSISV